LTKLRLSNYIDKKILVPEQYGFKKNISTTHAILDIVTDFYENVHNNDYSGLMLLDIKKFLILSLMRYY